MHKMLVDFKHGCPKRVTTYYIKGERLSQRFGRTAKRGDDLMSHLDIPKQNVGHSCPKRCIQTLHNTELYINSHPVTVTEQEANRNQEKLRFPCCSRNLGKLGKSCSHKTEETTNS